MADMPDATYVSNLLQVLRQELEGLHKRMNEVERLRYHEDEIPLPTTDKPSGLQLRIGMTAELIENVKAAITTNPAEVKVKPLRSGTLANANADKRAVFWTAYLAHICSSTPVLDDLADAQAGLGLGFLKAVYAPWPKKPRRRNKGESDNDYLKRQDALKRLWGPPFQVVTVHPLAMFCRPGSKNRLTEVIEHSWKPKRDVYAGDLSPSPTVKPDPDLVAALAGHPTENVQPLPAGVSQSDLVLTTEYWRGDLYQIYLNNSNQVHSAKDPAICYFVATGRSSSSKDPDKIGLSVADILRHTEPILNRTLTRMAEAAELLVRKRLTIELPDGAVAETEMDADNNPVPKTYKFDPEGATALPPGARVQDPFAGAEGVYGAMPFINLLMQMSAMHGVSPIFKGQSPGAAGSGYRDTSLYMMALSQFKHLLKSFSGCLTELVKWLEYCLVTHVKQTIWVGDLSLSPSDIKEWPAVVSATVEPFLPQNVIAEGHFWDYMYSKGHATRRMVLEEGLNQKDPSRIEKDRMLEDIQQLLKPALYQDVLERLGIITEGAVPGEEGAGDIQTRIKNVLQMGGAPGGATKPGEQQISGLATGGQGREPPYQPGSSPPGQENLYPERSYEEGV